MVLPNHPAFNDGRNSFQVDLRGGRHDTDRSQGVKPMRHVPTYMPSSTTGGIRPIQRSKGDWFSDVLTLESLLWAMENWLQTGKAHTELSTS